MSRVQNISDFDARLERIRDDYERHHAPKVASLRNEYVDPTGSVRPDVGRLLEHHARDYLINGFLEALNWRFNFSINEGLPSLIGEAAVRSARSNENGKKTIKYLDYLGFERETNRPLMIVEAKRPHYPPPSSAKISDSVLSPSAFEALCGGLRGRELAGEWTEWLETVQNYVQSLYESSGATPGRVVITNGEWMCLFLDPANAFLDLQEPLRSSEVLVYETWDQVENNSGEVFRHLEYSRVAKGRVSLSTGELKFHLSGQEVDRVMHGIRLIYTEEPGHYERWPSIRVVPILHLKLKHGTWFPIEDRDRRSERLVPIKEGQEGNRLLQEHLKEQEIAACELLSRVSEKLGKDLKPTSLVYHYSSSDFSSLPGVEKYSGKYTLVTGEATHYLIPEPSVPDCPFHSWVNCDRERLAFGSPIQAASTSPRTLFSDGRLHHCAHKSVFESKASQITESNQTQCGPRSNGDGHAFCEIWPFENHLCCRTCAFQKVCESAEVFDLPCKP